MSATPKKVDKDSLLPLSLDDARRVENWEDEGGLVYGNVSDEGLEAAEEPDG